MQHYNFVILSRNKLYTSHFLYTCNVNTYFERTSIESIQEFQVYLEFVCDVIMYVQYSLRIYLLIKNLADLVLYYVLSKIYV